MKGKILGYDSNSCEGAIIGEDKNRYTFELSEWKGSGTPKAETPVDFITNDGYAQKLYPVSNESDNSKTILGLIALLITFFLGFIGTLIARLALAKQPFSEVIVPVAIHAGITLCLFIPFIGWFIYILTNIYFMVRNYQLVNMNT
jgi:hypothetical protein